VGTADVTFSKGLIYQQPYDSITAHVQYVSADLQTATGVFVSGPKRVSFDVSYPHGGQPFPAGTLEISAASNAMALNQIALIRQRQPDIEGSAVFKGSGTLRISLDAKKVVHVELASIDGDGSVTHIGLGGRDLGDTHFAAKTQGTTLTASFDSNAAKAVIKGEARVELTGDDRTTGSITFSNAGLNALAALIVTEADAKNLTFDGSAEGRVDFSGPLFTPQQMSATATIAQIEVHPLPGTPLTQTIPGFSLRNNGAVKVAYENSVIRIDAARFQAPETDMTVSGTADISSASPLNLRLNGIFGNDHRGRHCEGKLEHARPQRTRQHSRRRVSLCRFHQRPDECRGRDYLLWHARQYPVVQRRYGWRQVHRFRFRNAGGGCALLSVLRQNQRCSPALSAGDQFDFGFRYSDCAELAAQQYFRDDHDSEAGVQSADGCCRNAGRYLL
jgi:hypothetical protein